MANLSSFFPAAASGGGASPTKTIFLFGTTSDQTTTFSPSSNDLSVGDNIFVTLIGGGTGGTVKGVGGTPQTHGSLGGAAGEFWQGYYELTSTSDITILAGKGGAGGTKTFSSGNSFTVTGTAGSPSTLTQDSSVILSSDNSVTTSMMFPNWEALTAGSTDELYKYLNTNTASLTVTAHGLGSAKSHSPQDARTGSGSGGGGKLIGTYGASGTITAGTGGAGLVIINW